MLDLVLSRGLLAEEGVIASSSNVPAGASSIPTLSTITSRTDSLHDGSAVEEV